MRDTTPQTVTIGTDGKVYKVSFQNQPLGKLVIKKYNSVTKEPLVDAEFEKTCSQGFSRIILRSKIMSNLKILQTKKGLKDAKFTVYKMNGEVLGHYITDGDGLIILDNLEPTWYKIVETKAPDGFLIDDTPRDVELTSNQFLKITFENKRLTSLVIKKVNDKTGEPLSGALFTVERQGGRHVGEYSTDKDGLINVPTLDPDFYIVREKRAPDGFLLDETPKTVEIKTNVPTVVTFTNKKLTALEIKKVSEKGEPLAGAVFAVEKQNGERVGEWTTDNTGFISIPTLQPDWYSALLPMAKAALWASAILCGASCARNEIS